MASLFISYSRQDGAAAERLQVHLQAAGFSTVYMDTHPELGIRAGARWEHELYSHLYRTDAVVFVASASSVESKWCFAEISLARSLGRLVIPLRLAPGVELGLLSDVQWVDLYRGDDGYTRLVDGLRRAGLDPDRSFRWDPTRSPYPGLQPFDADDAAVFFGREKETRRLVELLQPTLERGRGRFVGIVGPSGSGKSSLLRAGLMPRLQSPPGRWVVLPVVLPGRRPLRTLVRSLEDAFAASSHHRTRTEIAHALDGGPNGLRDLVEELRDRDGDVLLVIDQGEELTTRSAEGDRDAFLDLLRGALGHDSPLWVVATIRSEFLSGAPDRAGLADVIDDAIVVEPLHRRRLPEVIERPAQRAGLRFEPGLVARIVDETAGGDALPMMAHTLRELAERVNDRAIITWAAYHELGGVAGALSNRADRLLDELERQGIDHVLSTLLKLAAVHGTGEATRRRVQRDGLSASERFVMDAFLDARLLRSRVVADRPATVEVAHEALLRQWAPLRDAVEAARTSLRMRTEVERLAAEWDAGGRDDSYLLRGERLARFAPWTEEDASQLDERSRAFLDSSVRFEASAREQSRQASRRRRVLTTSVIGLLVLLVAVGVITAWSQIQREIVRRRVIGQTPMVALRGGVALLGADRVNVAPGLDRPAGMRLRVSPFQIDRHEVTNQAYEACVGVAVCSQAEEPPDPGAGPNFPVVYVDGVQAATFCRWLDRRLPTATEWERAARGLEGKPWPWGSARLDRAHANVMDDDGEPGALVAVTDDRFDGATPSGITHLVGNVEEWTSTPAACLTSPYTCGRVWDGRAGGVQGLLRLGGGFDTRPESILDSIPSAVGDKDESTGFRCARSAEGT